MASRHNSPPQADLWAYLVRRTPGTSVAPAERVFRFPSAFTWSANGKDADSTSKETLEALKRAHPTRHDWVDNGTSTHYVLTGGKLLFPETPIPSHVVIPPHVSFTSSLDEFRRDCPTLLGREATYSDVFWIMYGRYLSLVASGRAKRNISITEAITTPFFRFFIDLDLLFASQLDKPAWKTFVKSLTKNVAKALARCYPSISTKTDDTLDFTVLCTGFRGTKRGVHLVWPKLIVTKEVAIVIAAMVEETLSAHMYRETTRGENSWKDAVDIAVYNTGLRLVGCVKASKCMACATILSQRRTKHALHDSLREAETRLCHPEPPRGFIVDDEKSTYGLTHIARADGALYTTTLVRDIIARHVHNGHDLSARALTSIRAESATSETEGFVKPVHLCARAELADPYRRTTTTVDPVSGEVLTEKRAVGPQMRSLLQKAKEVIIDRTIHERLTEALRRFSPEHRQICVDRVWGWPILSKNTPLIPLRDTSNTLPSKRARFSEVWVMMKGPGSNYCHNKRAPHGKNKIRFHINYKGNVTQSCWSTKLNANEQKPCCKLTTKGNTALEFCLMDAYAALMLDIFSTGSKRKADDIDGNENNNDSTNRVILVAEHVAAPLLY